MSPRAPLAIAFGLGTAGALQSALLLAGAPRPLLSLSFLALPAAAIAAHRRLGPCLGPRAPLGALPRGDRLARAVAIAFGAAALLAAAIVVKRALESPDGGWDAWMIWNLRARALLRAQPIGAAFPAALPQTHPDYPLLVPALVASGWSATGGAAFVPIVLSAAFPCLTVALLVTAVGRRRGPALGLAAGLCLLGTPMFVWSATDQGTDLPLATFALAAAILLSEPGAAEAGAGLALSGALLSMAAWTKNEGLLYLLAFFVPLALWDARRPGSGRGGAALRFLFGAAPLLALLAYFKWRLAPPSDLAQPNRLAQLFARLVEPRRIGLLALLIPRRLAYFQAWGLWLLAAVAAALAFVRGRPRRPELGRLGQSLVLVFGGFSLVYLATPYDLVWHLQTSVDRLLLQCWPLALLFLFSALSPAVEPPGGSESKLAREALLR